MLLVTLDLLANILFKLFMSVHGRDWSEHYAVFVGFCLTVMCYVMSFLFAYAYFFSSNNNMEVDVTVFISIEIKKMRLEKVSNVIYISTQMNY